MSRPKPWEISDELWAVIEPLLPRHERRYRYPGRKRIDDRRTLQGVLFVLYTEIQWEFLPQELGFGHLRRARFSAPFHGTVLSSSRAARR